MQTSSAKVKRKETSAREQYLREFIEWQSQRSVYSCLLENAGGVPGEDTSEIFCRPGELIIGYVPNAALVEDRLGPGQSQGASNGVSTPIGLGVRYRAGRRGGQHSKGAMVPTHIDVGTIWITSRRVIFIGKTQTRECLFEKMLGFDCNDAIGRVRFLASNNQKPTTIDYGTIANTKWFPLRMDLAIAHYHGNAEEYIAQIQSKLDELDRTKPTLAGSPVAAVQQETR